ncbi:hypothetical protein [Streptomyces caniscabiei]|uniref:hypothetical protein n=1 Tax=Streptomyces caniscabiei TaxID=2746961 RepID=UPI0023DA0071|nr:hypothetical protein [Streptomyces caniscabiei]WEO24903.1 hypothetical protein IHE65_17890 [Streptomyces caniscabiei]
MCFFHQPSPHPVIEEAAASGSVPTSMISTPMRMYINTICTKLDSITSRPKISTRPGWLSVSTPSISLALSPRFDRAYTSLAYASDAFIRAVTTGTEAAPTRMTFHIPMNACRIDWPLRSTAIRIAASSNEATAT